MCGLCFGSAKKNGKLRYLCPCPGCVLRCKKWSASLLHIDVRDSLLRVYIRSVLRLVRRKKWIGSSLNAYIRTALWCCEEKNRERYVMSVSGLCVGNVEKMVVFVISYPYPGCVGHEAKSSNPHNSPGRPIQLTQQT